MPTDPKKRQKQQERRKAKRKAKQQEITKEKHAGLAERLTAAAQFPVYRSWATEDLWTQGLGQVCISRALPNGLVAFAIFLVDRYCLGVKDAWAEIIAGSDYESRIEGGTRSNFTVRNLSPASVRKIVESAVAYANDLSLHPHADYQKARALFGDINAAEGTEDIEFGKNGKPFFIAGPHDTMDRCRRILSTLVASRGPDGFEFAVPFTDTSKVLPEALAGRDVRVIPRQPTGTLPASETGELDDG
jgi:hypothetical protein